MGLCTIFIGIPLPPNLTPPPPPHRTRGYLCSFPITWTLLSRVSVTIGDYKTTPFFGLLREIFPRLYCQKYACSILFPASPGNLAHVEWGRGGGMKHRIVKASDHQTNILRRNENEYYCPKFDQILSDISPERKEWTKRGCLFFHVTGVCRYQREHAHRRRPPPLQPRVRVRRPQPALHQQLGMWRHRGEHRL